MAAAPGAVQRQAWVDGVLPPVEQVRPGLWSIPVPIPDNPLRYVLVYAFELPDGVAIVDAGWDTEEAWTALVEGLSKAGCDITDVSAVLITHVHPDHYGLAGRVREHSGAWVGVHPADAAVLPTRYGEVEPLVASMRDLLVDCGVPEVELDELSSASLGIRQFVRQAEPDRFIDDGDRLPLPGWNLRAIWTPGHSPGHLCFAEPDRRLMLTGDCVLPRITPNISVHPQQAANPLADFLASLAKLRGYQPDEVLPAHEYRFDAFTTRLDELFAHHRTRLGEIERAVADCPGATCWQITTRLGWSRPWAQVPNFMRRAANGETLAHLALLAAEHRVEPMRDTVTTWWPKQ
ncbi:MAG: MBL fold metallo-hydrolase [Mycobacterium sp.]|nr:MBL fold metallo-hydrolase [Mycobacterium sp.]